MNSLTLPNSLVSVDWLKHNCSHPQLVILDASSHMPGTPRDAHQEWQEQHIAGAKFFDFNNKICDTHSPLPHMLPSAEIFTHEAQALGINQDSIIVIYDSLGIFSAPRAWWMFSVMGHQQCAVLDGGLPEWLAQGGTTESHTEEKDLTPNTISTGNFSAHLQVDKVKNKAQILAAIANNDITIIDSRSKKRFDGLAEETRKDLISGHIPSSKSLPFTELLTNGKMKPTAQLKRLLDEKVTGKTELYSSCGSGVTACIITFAAHLAGFKQLAVYDGSWCEWGQPELDLPIDTYADIK
ncbi:MAG: thiosulfate/3-mercaptopyruvate sulfurtransferase [Candidatus Endobugula sp.]|jgi:thiosulfate/3-mercaptopyruvate sulfurtransferase